MPKAAVDLPFIVAGVHDEQRPVAALAGGQPVLGDDAGLPCGI